LNTITITRGRSFATEAYPAGTLALSLILTDTEAGFDVPGPRWSWRSQITIGDEIRIRAIHADSGIGTVTLYRGDIRSLSDRWSPYGVHTLEITATDLLARLGRIDPLEREFQGAGERSGARMGRIADIARIPETRRAFDAGLMSLQATNLARNLAGEAEVTAASEGGDLWVDGAGILTFRQRQWWRTDPNASHVQFTWANTDVPPLDPPDPEARDDEGCPVTVNTRLSLDLVANVVNLARAGGTVQTARDTASMSLYGPQTYARSDLLSLTDADVASLAAFRVAESGGRTRLIDGVEVDPLGDPGAWRGILRGDLGQLHRLVWDDGDEITDALVWLQGITHRIDPIRWKTSLRVWDRYQFSPAAGWDIHEWDAGLWSAPVELVEV
jgi:hypothetical protein